MASSSFFNKLGKNVRMPFCNAVLLNVAKKDFPTILGQLLVSKSKSVRELSSYVPPHFRYGEFNSDRESDYNEVTDRVENPKEKKVVKDKSETIRRLQAMAHGTLDLESLNPDHGQKSSAHRSANLLQLQRKNPTRLSNREFDDWDDKQNSDRSKKEPSAYRNKLNEPSFPRSTEKENFSYGIPKKEQTVSYRATTPREQPLFRTIQKEIAAQPGHDILFGIHPISIALEAGKREFVQLWYKTDTEISNPRLQQILQVCKERNIKTVATDEHAFLRGLPRDRAHQGVAAETSRLSAVCLNAEELETNVPAKTLWTLLWEIQDPMNLGSIVRSGTFLGVNRVLVTKDNSCSLSPVASKASAGALEVVPLFSVTSPISLIEKLRECDWEVVATSSQAGENSIALHDYNQPEKPTLLIIGNEGKGIPAEVEALCSTSLHIAPGEHNHKLLDSMNVGAAAAVLFHTLALRGK